MRINKCGGEKIWCHAWSPLARRNTRTGATSAGNTGRCAWKYRDNLVAQKHLKSAVATNSGYRNWEVSKMPNQIENHVEGDDYPSTVIELEKTMR